MRKIKFKVIRINQPIEGEINFTSCFAGGKYTKAYNRDEIVRERSLTLGIMVFEKRSQAIKFIKSHVSPIRCPLHIKRVLPIGKGKRPPLISKRASQEGIYEFYQRYAHFKKEWIKVSLNSTPLVTPPEGTICYPAVKVLD